MNKPYTYRDNPLPNDPSQTEPVPNDEAYWLTLAQQAITSQPGYANASVTWLAHTHNAVFLVENEAKNAVLYLYEHGVDFDMLLSEWEWLRAISMGTHLTVSQYLKLIQVRDEQTQQLIQGAIRQYLAGEPVAPANLTPAQMSLIGDFLAELHDFSARYTPIPNFVRPHLDYEGLFGPDGIYHPGEGVAVFTAQQNAVMQAVTEHVRTAMTELGKSRSEYGLIHGDLLSKNILFHEGNLRAIDFEYSGWGYYLYDLTPLLWQLKAQANYSTLAEALWNSYTSKRPLSARHKALLETFIAARQVASMRWLASNMTLPTVRDNAELLIAQRTTELEGFLQSGILNRHSITL
ncbi:phosphotransferase [Phototrophicus methaneseepsis]|uniref:Phosphotransferase n=1 Tax=Phototrophicus methaneseepsis TaxID=2710758 RepID=A0A7S8EDE1_9CHLR|nr:phosphotransferase [Phototrophicus methaneseepsis]QPC84902.1 phosphotransferase [Phototrophicus methaneseepsis]